MSHLASFARFGLVAVAAVALGAACGGKSVDVDGGDEGGSSAGGTPGSGATSSTSGKPPVGGSIGTGGTGATPVGGATSTSGTGSGGNLNLACVAQPEAGPCEAAQPAWYHDAGIGICRPFTYGGCGGNDNRYTSLEECQKACPSQGLNYDACTQPSDCVVTGTGCCGVCDSPSLTKHDFIAYNRKYQAALQCAGVPLTLPPPGSSEPAGAPVACAPCPPVVGGARQYFVPDCVQNQCTVVDLRDPQFTACMTAEDCTYRLGTACCASCHESEAIALRKDARIESLVCSGDGDVACGACPPISPKAAPIPQCGANGRCELAYLAY
ncbi:MAG: hypothetical protein EOO73_20965 [Myxococcales bacterium]|nr:MAG: hypothetical protein EOO73_20965 [Myxococcales bacterium]